MSGSPMSEIVSGYVEEVRTYIPMLIRGLDSLGKDPEQREITEELHRLVHTIKGASLMVGIPGLSNIALQMEMALADILAGKLAFSEAASEVMTGTVGQFEAYCDGLAGDGVASRSLLREAVLAYRRLRGLPPEEDEAAVALLTEGVPEHEGGGIGGTADEEVPEIIELMEAEAVPEPQVPEPVRPAPDIPEIPPELLESFYEEAREHLEDLDSALNILESEVREPLPVSPDQKEVIRRIRRSVHTLKGAAAVIGLANVSAWGHTMEDFLDWLYEEAREISPETVALLMDSGDLLAHITENPADPRTDKCQDLNARYADLIRRVTAASAPVPATEPVAKTEEAAVAAKTDTCASASLPVTDPSQPDLLSHPNRTLRVGTERVDSLVNLAGELIIVASAFDQKFGIFTDGLSELEMARNRIREIARNMEVGYEVKALTGLRPGRQGQPPSGEAVAHEALPHLEDFDSLELDRYSELSLIIRTLNESAIDLSAIYSRLSGLGSEFEGHFNRQQVLLSELQDKVMQIRMLPMSGLSNKLRRTVREVSKKLGKKVRLVITGENIELDRMIWDKLTDPFMHLMRNAVDHGIDTPERRREKGKPPMATLKLGASREGNQVVIRISDDGNGLDYGAIRKKALRAGLIGEGDDIPEEELAALIFKPGLSTRDTISEVSGRGVGMDVVRENIHDLKGTVRVASWPGKGTRFVIRIPLTLAAVRALLFTVAGRTFAVALTEVREIVRVDPRNLIRQPRYALRLGDDILPLRSLREILHIEKTGDRSAPTSPAPVVLVLQAGDTREAFEVDALAGQREIVIKSTGSHLRHVRGISGVTITGDGSVVPILNIPELIGGRTDFSEPAGVSYEGTALSETERPLSVLVVDDSVSIRQVVSRLIEEQGWEARTAKDGIDALEKLQKGKPDLIILDIEMPRMNGYEFLSALRADSRYPDIPVIMLTSRATGKHQEKASALGASGFMIKPYNNNEFIDLILRLTA